MVSVAVIVQVYNSEHTLRSLVERTSRVLEKATPKHQFLLVNDGSQDGSWDVIYEFSRTSSKVRGIDLMRDFGQHNALLCGIREAPYDIAVTMDDDLPITGELASQMVRLPWYCGLQENEQELIAETVRRFLIGKRLP